MEVIPAIDIRGGKCVRLFQGDYDRETVYSDDPAEMASQWVDQGATRLHVIDLDGAREGRAVNHYVASAIASKATVPVQLGGGIRDVSTARAALAGGVGRIIAGTAAITEPSFARALCDELGASAVVVSVDARDGVVMLQGWTATSGMAASEVVKGVEAAGVTSLIYTDIAVDGTLTGPNFRAISELVKSTPLDVIIAGGISSLAHLLELERIGVEAAIVGKAVYTGDIDLPEAIAALSGPSTEPIRP
jgi:phosphoribosylformimino-5-aminoimidazole carboxamide ribotide isomerase